MSGQQVGQESIDIEKAVSPPSSETYSDKWGKQLLTWGVEARGIRPVPMEERIDKQFSKIFFIWFSMNFNILSFSTGTLGPVVFGLGLRDSCLVILFFNLLCLAPPAYLATWGPKLGLRQMVQARYTFGYYGVILPCIFNLIGICGFTILNAILGGQTLAAVADGSLSWTVGIVIVTLISLCVSFCGYNFLSWYGRLAWIPVLLAFLVALGVGGKHLANPPPAEAATAAAILGFAATIAGFDITYSPLSSDYTSYFHPDVSSAKIFLYSYLGLLLPIVPLECLGAAVVVNAPSVPTWETGYANGNVGGLLEAILRPTGNFGKFLTVMLSLCVVGNMAPGLYSISLNIQIFIPWLVIVPRYVCSLLAAAVIVSLSIVGSHRFYDTLTNFLGLIGYWASSFSAIILVEHFLFRRNNFTSYDLQIWNDPGRLPTGIAALGAGIASVAIIVPSIDQVWFVGSIAKVTGDIGFEVAFFVSGVLYVPFRWIEIRLRKTV
jgi:NCS1 nucleoside transporter family